MNKSGVTLIEIMMVVVIITILSGLGVATLMDAGLSSVSKARGEAKNLQQFLILSRLKAIGLDQDRNNDGKEDRVIVAFDTVNNWYYAFLDMDNDGVLDSGEQPEDLRLPMPDMKNDDGSDIVINGLKARVVKLQPYVNYGASGVNQRKPSIQRDPKQDSFVYYCVEDSSPVTASGNTRGLHLAGYGTKKVSFTKRGTATSGSIYLCLTAGEEDPVSYNYSVSISSTAKINLWEWTKVEGVDCWKRIN